MWRKLFLALLALLILTGNIGELVFGAAGELNSENLDADFQYAKANLLLQSGLYQQAKEKFIQILSKNPQHQGALAGMIEVEKGFFKEKRRMAEPKKEEPMLIAQPLPSLEKAKEAESLEKDYALGLEFFKKKNYTEARNYLKKIAGLNPNYKNIPGLLADISLALNIEKEEERRSAYTLGPGDILNLYVKDNEEMSKEIKIQPGGELVVPSVNEVIMVNNLLKEKLEGIIKLRLKKYLKEPEVQVVVKEYNSKKWYILGEIGSRNEYSIGKPQLTLLEAMYQAGLPTEDGAAMRRVQLIHPAKDGPVRKKVNVYALLYQGDLSQNLVIHPGDIIYVPKLTITKLTSTLTTLRGPLSEVRSAMGDTESVNTLPPVTRVGSGPGQVKN